LTIAPGSNGITLREGFPGTDGTPFTPCDPSGFHRPFGKVHVGYNLAFGHGEGV
jgi:hypothetical protein